MASLTIDAAAFGKRWGALSAALAGGTFGAASVLAVATGKAAEELAYLKSTSLQVCTLCGGMGGRP